MKLTTFNFSQTFRTLLLFLFLFLFIFFATDEIVQYVGDFVIVPPRAAHQVWNRVRIYTGFVCPCYVWFEFNYTSNYVMLAFFLVVS